MVLALTGSYVAAAPTPTRLSNDDTKLLAEQALRWAVDGGIGDVKLMKDPASIVVADYNLPKRVKLEVPGRQVRVMSFARIQLEADRLGDFLHFRFDRFKPDGPRVTVAIALVWAVGSTSRTPYLSGGGATLEFEKRDGQWQLLPVTNLWMS